ncbi:hypothetical protein [Burkholderia plantarii]|uniref:hypothetical protein n=1 Tax=Burkholderia plantarii TaxID=41899 RepID=UPI0005AED6B8|nr:hypothetical protein [Burkholderia plantarii]ALK30482.1 hypothetical protein bpln_1g16770 [Burkholderia plantarii]WLE59178.1 hypothetical protein GIY62_00225 [Burkholderia plantarii]GLZ19842.1 hypothetical protein Bpla01_33710 [Burkholderia plantarii]
MERLARLLPFRQFGRLRHLRGRTPCAPLVADSAESAGFAESGTLPLAAEPAALPSALPAFARVSLNAGLHHAEPARRAPVRVYHGQSRVIMVGTIDAVCRMIDRCIAEERSAV